MDGTAMDGTGTDGTATDGTATDGTATDGTATDGAGGQSGRDQFWPMRSWLKLRCGASSTSLKPDRW